MQAYRAWGDRVMRSGNVLGRFNGEPAKPCPFCSSTTIGLWMGPSPHMTCGGCGADGPVFDGSRETLMERQDQAFRAWQGSLPRPPMTPVRSIT